ncbi:MAG: ABC transporter ATP-binding protein [Candidatus Firestonebacteria bacterium]
MKELLRFLRFLIPYKFQITIGIICVIITSILTLPLPWIIKIIIDDILLQGKTTSLNWISVLIIIIFIIRGMFSFLRNYIITWIGQKFVFDLRVYIYHHLQNLSLKFFETRQTGKIIARITGDVDAVYNVIINGLINLITDTATFLIVLVILFIMDWKLAFLSITVLPFFALNYAAFRDRIVHASRLSRRQWDKVLGNLHESLSGTRVVKSFGMENYETKHFKEGVKTNFEWNMYLNTLGTTLWAIAEVISSIGTAIVFWFGGHQVIRGYLTTGELVAFYTFLGYLYAPIVRSTQFNDMLQRALVSVKRIFNILDTKADIADENGAIELPAIKGHIEFKNVSFSYTSEKLILHNINLVVNPGEMVALVGPSGAGKTTFINLLARFYDPTSGAIFIDGYNTKSVTLNSLRSQIGIVLQETFLFSGSIRDNIRYGKLNANTSEIIEAAKAAYAHDFILQLSKKYKTPIGERGVKLSGGQKQRISIARAILRNPPILILDEATSSLDSETEYMIQTALEKLMLNRTTFVIAHRLSTILRADKIVVMENGQLVDVGKHDELLNKCEIYTRLYETQFKPLAETETPSENEVKSTGVQK